MARMRSEERREQILSVAAEAFAQYGYHATTVDTIVTGAGVARGTFYSYFQDKRSIFEELLDGYMKGLHAQIIRIDPKLGPTRAMELMRQNFNGVLSECLEQSALTKILLSEAVGLDEGFDERLL
ncbi:MAG: helix-turn-helix transcriptional regulator, partial [Myxococcales bacterium]|nr:helix-turn-helix transcriptional regulator [Myxococcales bacterium]